MKVVKSKYSSKELQTIYDRESQRIDIAILEKIYFVRLAMLIIVALASLCIVYVAVQHLDKYVSALSLTHSSLWVATLIILSIGIVVLTIDAMLYLSRGVGKLLKRFYAKRGVVLTNYFDEHKLLSYIRIIRKGEELSEMLSEDRDTKYIFYPEESKLCIIEVENCLGKVRAVIEFGEFLDWILNENECVLDFSRVDDTVEEILRA